MVEKSKLEDIKSPPEFNFIADADQFETEFDAETHALFDNVSDLNLNSDSLDSQDGSDVLNENNELEEFPDNFIDQNEMMETSDDQDILGSPHSSFSYDDTFSENEIDGLTNYNIILEYPRLDFDDILLLPFNEELKDWFSCKDLKHLDSVSKISESVTVDDLSKIKSELCHLYYDNSDAPQGKILQYLLQLSYISMGCFNDAHSQNQIEETIFDNVKCIIRCDGLLEVVIDILEQNSLELTDILNLESDVNILRLKLLSNQFFFSLTIVYIILLSFNVEGIEDYKLKKQLSQILEKKQIMIFILKAIDRWKWLSSNSDTDDITLILESMVSKVNDDEKIQILAVTQFKARNVIAVLNQLLLFLFGDLEQIKSTEEFLKYKWEDSKKKKQSKNDHKFSDDEDLDDEGYKITSIDYEYYVAELLSRYPTYSPPKYGTSEIMEMIINNENRESMSNLINVDSLPINQHQNLKNNRINSMSISNELPDIHIATPMPSPTLTPQHTGNSRNYSRISEFEHTSNEIKRKLHIAQSNFPNIYPSEKNAPKSIKDASAILFNNIKDSFNVKQFTSVFEDFIMNENGFKKDGKDSKAESHESNYVYTDKDIQENPLFEDEIHSLQNVETFYKKGMPYFNSLIYLILRLLVSNIIPSQQASENGKTRQRAPYSSKNSEKAKEPYKSTNLSTSDKQKLEITRMKETVLKNASSVLLLIQKWFKLSHILKFEYFTTLLFDNDYFIYLFRYLDSNKIQAHAGKDFDFRDKKTLINNRLVYCDYNVLYHLEDFNFFLKCLKLSKHKFDADGGIEEEEDYNSIFNVKRDTDDDARKNPINPLSFILPFTPNRETFTINKPNLRCCVLIKNLLESMYLSIQDFKIQRIYKLIGIRPTEILRFYLTLHNKLFYLPILKTIKMICPFIGKKWRANNMDLISFVYLFYKIELKDTWLNNYFNVTMEENSKRGFDNEIALRSLIKFYNFTNYCEELKEFGYKEDMREFFNETNKNSTNNDTDFDYFTKECVYKF